MRKTVLFLVGLLLLLSNVLQGGIAYAEYSSKDVNHFESPGYYLIHYDGEKQTIVLDENITLTFMGWTDETNTSVSATFNSTNQVNKQINEVTLDVFEGLNEVVISDEKSLYFRLVGSDSFKISEVKLEEQSSSGILETKKVINISSEEAIINDENLTLNDSQGEKNIQQHQVSSLLNAKVNPSTPTIKYRAHIENIGWQDYVNNGMTAGTVKQGLQMEAIDISTEEPGQIVYNTHVQDVGWVQNSGGTTGRGLQLEAIQINVTGDLKKNYDIYYRVHVESYGWLDWAKNGESAGSQGHAKQIEAIEIELVEKGGLAPGSTNKPFVMEPSIVYSTHVQDYGWMGSVKDGKMSGTQGQGKQIEALKIDLKNAPYPGGLSYKTHVQDYGWLENVTNGGVSGTTGKGKQVEAIQIQLTGEIEQHYDVYYRVHSEYFGWLDWAKNGEPAGTEGLLKQIEAIEIVLKEKGESAPGNTSKTYLTAPSISYTTHVQDYGWMDSVVDGEMSGTQGQSKQLEAIKIDLKSSPYSGNIVYSTHVQDYGWMNDVFAGNISGTIRENKQLEAITINLTGEIAKFYDVYYRVHAQDFGWLDWAKNGMKAGTEGFAKQLEAIEIKLVQKGKGKAVNADAAFKKKKIATVFLDPGHGGTDPGAVSGGYSEANLNLAVAKKVQSILLQRGYKVHMSRDNNKTVSLYDRAKMANEIKPDIFVSIHHNAGGASGIESIFYKYHPDYPPSFNGDMHNNPDRINKSETLANLIQGNLIQTTGANSRGTYGSALAVLRETTMPATLLELGFIDNSGERQKLITDSYQNKLAKAIADGIDQYFKLN